MSLFTGIYLAALNSANTDDQALTVLSAALPAIGGYLGGADGARDGALVAATFYLAARVNSEVYRDALSNAAAAAQQGRELVIPNFCQ